jgi:hypothetical protein
VLITAAVLVGLWSVGVTTLGQLVGWFAADLVDSTGSHVTGVYWAVVSWSNAALVAGPAGLLWALSGSHAGVRQTARAFTLAGLAAGVVGSARTVPLPHNELTLLLTAALAYGGSFLVRRPAPRTRVGLGWAVTAGLLTLLPWLWAGALGGPTETGLALVAAAAVGWLFASIVDSEFFVAFGQSRVVVVLVGGLAVGAALVPFGAAVGGRGVNLAELVTLPALGIAAAGLASGVTPARLGRAPVAAMVGIAAAGPLALLDPEETSLLLGFHDVGYYATVGGLLAVVVGLVVSIVYGVGLRAPWLARGVTAAATALAVLLAAGVYVAAGRPGFFGERLFVVMADQADLSGLAGITDRDQRVRATYDRLVGHARQTQAPLVESLRRLHLSYTPYYLVNGVMVDGGPAVRAWLSTRSDVDRVLLDPRLRPLPAQTPTEPGDAPAPDGSPQWNIAMIGADRVWTEFGARGQGIVIGSSDSGVDGAHPALSQQFRGGDDSWLDPWNGTTSPTDHGGHGTHTMGTVLGRQGIGVAPDARWIGCVNLDRNAASPSRYLDCLQFMLAPYPSGADPFTAGRPERAPNVLTNSWGCPGTEGCDLNSLRPAIDALRAAGIFFAAAAGNEGPGCGTVDDPPAPYASAFTVGAVDAAGEISSFSSRGPTPDGRVKPDIVAPGERVLSATPRGTYAQFDGTSMATPHVAGVVALMWSANPRLIGDIEATERILRTTATPVSAPTDTPACPNSQDVTGAGLVNAEAAVRASLAV